MNWADAFWRYDAAEVAAELDAARLSAAQARDANGCSLLALAVKYADPEAPGRTIAMLDALFQRGADFRVEQDVNVLVEVGERDLGLQVLDALLAWFYQHRARHMGSPWRNLDHEALLWACHKYPGDLARHLLAAVTLANTNSDRTGELPLLVLQAAVASDDEAWALEIARHPVVESSVKAVEIPALWHAESAQRAAETLAPPLLRRFVRCVEGAIHRQMGRVTAQLDYSNHCATALTASYYIYAVPSRVRSSSVSSSSSDSSSSSSSSSSCSSPRSHKRPLSNKRARRHAPTFVVVMAARFTRDIEWHSIQEIAVARHRALASQQTKLASPTEFDPAATPHPLLIAPAHVFALILSFVPPAEVVRETLEAFGAWTRWRPSCPRERKPALRR